MSSRAAKRARVDIYAGILEVIRRYPGGGRISRVSYGVGVPIDRLKPMLEELSSYGLVKKSIADGETRYVSSVRGLDFLETYWKMNAFLETFEGVETRELAAIMFTDIHAYTALVQRNEKDALRMLQEHERMVRGALPRYHGREVKTIGDAFLIEFTSALEACRCAVELQRALKARNREVAEKERMELRVGIHVGDVERRGTDILGDAVNIASRIQSVAHAGEIWISRQVFDQVWNKLDNHLSEIGQVEAKNVQAPLEVFRIDVD
jgi:class 3 adenylate cyclase/predicted transcriptional regulator